MVLLTITIIAVGLAMDAFAVSVVSGAAYRQFKIKHAFRLALFFGGFQAFMPLIGFLAGQTVKGYIANYDHWVAFALLAAVGTKMIYESTKIKPAKQNLRPFTFTVLLALSIATSIDALAVGITLSLLRISIVTAAIIIGIVTLCLSYAGVFIGKNFGHFFESKIEALGGLILIAIGFKILLEHLF
jgi:putative Mn2+ efflux pump MntP